MLEEILKFILQLFIIDLIGVFIVLFLVFVTNLFCYFKHDIKRWIKREKEE